MQIIKEIRKHLHWLRVFYNRYFLIPYYYRQTAKLNILNTQDSLQYILDHKCSVSRYGDGEFYVMEGGCNNFQQFHPKLGKQLIEVFSGSSHVSNHVIGIPLALKDVSTFKPTKPYNFWQLFVARHWPFIKFYLRYDVTYLDSLFTRFHYGRADKSFCADYVKKLKSLWQDKDILMVEGANTRSGYGNDLYDNAKSLKRILCPSLNAYDRYDEILQAVKQHATKDHLILISLGMTATVLAYDLAKEGLWAIDLGHLDIEYEWFKMGVETKVAVKGKFVNECADGHDLSECNDPVYLDQILVDLSK